MFFSFLMSFQNHALFQSVVMKIYRQPQIAENFFKTFYSYFFAGCQCNKVLPMSPIENEQTTVGESRDQTLWFLPKHATTQTKRGPLLIVQETKLLSL